MIPANYFEISEGDEGWSWYLWNDVALVAGSNGIFDRKESCYADIKTFKHMVETAYVPQDTPGMATDDLLDDLDEDTDDLNDRDSD